MKALTTGLLFSLALWGRHAAPPQLSQPERDFETFWQTFRDHYAFFRLHRVDWDQAYATYRPGITAATTPDQLLATLQKMVEPLADSHITISRGREVLYQGKGARRSYKEDFRSTQEQYWQNAYQTLEQAGFTPVRAVGPKPGKYHLLYLATAPHQNVGYLRLSRCFAELSGAIGSDRQERVDQQRLLALFDEALQELSSCRALILDLRGNGGGHSGKEMAARLASNRRLTHLTATRQPGGYEQFSPLAPHYLEPQPSPFQGKPLLVLTNDATASAAEELVTALYQQSNVTTIGSNTAGMLSDMYQGRLSRGVAFTLSHQRYYAADTTLLEGRGVPVRIPVAHTPQHLAQHLDPELSKALELL